MGKGAPHAGFPEAALPKYAQKFVELGYKLGIVEQSQEAGVVERLNLGLGRLLVGLGLLHRHDRSGRRIVAREDERPF